MEYRIQLLIIDDTASREYDWRQLLDGSNFDPLLISSSRDALAHLENSLTDIILIKLNLPRIDGVSFIRMFRKLNRPVPIVVFMDEPDIPQTVAAMKAGASDVILSAELPDRLPAVLKNALKISKSENEDGNTTENEVIRELERKTYSLAMGNIAMLEMQEKLEAKNAELNSVLRDYSRSRENLQAILDISPTAIIMVNESDKIIAYNKRVLQYFGIKNESVDNCRFDDFLNTIAPTFNHFDAFKKTIEQPDQMLKPEEFAQLARLSDFQRHVFSLSHPVTRMIVPFLTYPEPFGEGKRCRIYTFMDVTELRQANAMLHAIVDASPLPFIVSRLSDGEILYANKPLADLVGREPHEAIGMKTLNFYANESDRIDVVRKIQENKQLQNHEVLIRKADGSSAWMSFSLVVTELDGEEVIIGGLYDIDVRRRAEEALIESEERFRQLTENIREVFWIYDVKSGKPLYLSPAYESITGLDRNAMMEHLGALLNIIHPDDRQRINTAMLKQITGEFDEEYRIIKPNGEVRWIRERAFPIHNEDGEVVRICGVSEDFTERKSVENALRQSEEALRTIFNASYDAIIIHDEFGKVIDVNDKMLWLYGVSREEALQMSVPSFNSQKETTQEKLYELWKEVMDGKPQFFEWIARRPGDQTTFTVEVFLQKIPYNNRQVILANIRDITARKRAEENLLLYRKIFDNSNDPISIISANNTIAHVNPAVTNLFGFTPEEMQGKSPGIFIGEDVVASILHSRPTETPGIRKEIRFINKSGKEVIIELSGFPIYNDDGKLIYRVGISRDITERKRAQEALQHAHDILEIRVKERTAALEAANHSLQKSEERNSALLNAIPDLMFRMQKDGTYLDYHAPKDSDLAIPPEAVIGKNLRDTMPPKHLELAFRKIHETIASNEWQLLEYDMPHGDHTHYFEARIVKSGEDEVISIVRDITERKQSEKALKRAHEQLEQRVKERTAELETANRHLRETQTQLIQTEKMATLGMLAAGVAHEINTPVGAISSMHDTQTRAMEKLKVLIEKESPNLFENSAISRIVKLIDDAQKIIGNGTDRVTNIVKQLRRFARLDEAELKEADIHEGIEDTLQLIRHEIKHHITVVKEFGDVPPISFYPSKLNQVVLNLVMNAKQAISGDGTVTIKTWHENGQVFIKISDSGSGIPAKNLPKIFDPGFTTKGVGVGTGLGLSIVYRIITEDHRGSIRVESEVGKGTVFTISIPDNLDEILNHK